MTIPAKSPITLAFGATTDPYTPSSPHKGTDFAYLPDNHIYAPFSGRVTLRPNNGNDGNGIYLTAPNGDFHGLLHSSQYLVADGEQVTEGQPIAIMGQTGLAYGVHLHWCVKRNNVFIDPMSLITKGDNMDEINELTKQLDNTNKALDAQIAATAELTKQLDNTNKAVDALAAEVETLKQSGLGNGLYELIRKD